VTFRRSRFIAGLALALGVGFGLAASLPARSQGMGPGGAGGYGRGSMGGGMMGGGMMGGYGPRSEPPGQGNASAPARELLSYVQSNGLPCMSCHAFSGRGAGPALFDIAHRFAGQESAESELARAISEGVYGQWPGYPPMQGGMARPAQASKLAGLILQLAR
jgi:cytochrome c551/c552